eukprot:1069948-Pelagomonas_calceolata.AAC.1
MLFGKGYIVVPASEGSLAEALAEAARKGKGYRSKEGLQSKTTDCWPAHKRVTRGWPTARNSGCSAAGGTYSTTFKN